MHNTYRLAGHAVKIESIYPQVHTLCADYRTDDSPEYVITTTEADIAFERAKSARENLQEGAPVQEYESSYLETLAVYRKLAQVQWLPWMGRRTCSPPKAAQAKPPTPGSGSNSLVRVP